MKWRPRPTWMFNAAPDQIGRIAKAWNAQFAGKACCYKKLPNGYLVGSIMNKTYYAHRVVYALGMGKWPESQIDHINGIRSDNRFSNLRAVTQMENSRNMRRSKANKSGVTGVFWNKGHQKWTAHIRAQKQSRWLGNFARREDAIAARKAAERKYGFHPNHGRSK